MLGEGQTIPATFALIGEQPQPKWKIKIPLWQGPLFQTHPHHAPQRGWVQAKETFRRCFLVLPTHSLSSFTVLWVSEGGGGGGGGGETIWKVFLRMLHFLLVLLLHLRHCTDASLSIFPREPWKKKLFFFLSSSGWKFVDKYPTKTEVPAICLPLYFRVVLFTVWLKKFQRFVCWQTCAEVQNVEGI